MDRGKIQDQVQKISNILEGLNLTLSLTKIDKETFKEENPIKLIRKLIVDKLNENPRRQIIFENKLEKQNTRIKMDSNLFLRMLENILKNSLAYTDGKITLAISESTNNLIIRILDEGEGISGNIISKVYEEDLTNITKHGLGIFISKQIAEVHGGSFTIKNKNPGLEVKFVFEFN